MTTLVTLLLVGKTGNGKSSTANTILEAGHASTNSTPFTLAHSFSSATTTMESEECLIGNKTVKVINTPDLANPKLTASGKVLVEKGEEPVDVETWVDGEIQRWIKESGGKPNAVVLVIRCDRRYTKEEMDIYTQLKKLLNDDMEGNLVIVFTGGDFLDSEGDNLKVTLDEACSELKAVLEDAKDRYVVFDNKTEDKEKRKKQVQDLLEIVQNMHPPKMKQ